MAGTELSTLRGAAIDAWRAGALGVVPQRLHLSASLSVDRNLALPYLCAGLPIDVERLQALKQRLGLQGLGARRPQALSVGQAQRVALARALARAPRVLMADEPTANLDDAHADEAVALLLDTAHDAGATLVLATHDRRLLDTAVQLAWWRRRAGGAAVTRLAALAWTYLWARPLVTVLNLLLLSLGLAAVTFVLLASDQIDRNLRRDLAGIDLVVGAKGSPMQIMLSGIYHLDVPTGNIPLATVKQVTEHPWWRKRYRYPWATACAAPHRGHHTGLSRVV